MQKFIRNLIISLSLLAMAACGTTSASNSGLSRDQFISASQEERMAEIQRIKTEKEMTAEWEIARLQAGLPVPFEYEGTGYALQCIRFPGSKVTELAVYHGHNAPGMSRATHQSLAAFLGDEHCALSLIDRGGVKVPIQNRNNSTAQEDFGRMMLRVATPGFTQGLGLKIADEILGEDDCCGTTFNLMGGRAVAGAVNENLNVTEVGITTDVTVGRILCPTGNCDY